MFNKFLGSLLFVLTIIASVLFWYYAVTTDWFVNCTTATCSYINAGQNLWGWGIVFVLLLFSAPLCLWILLGVTIYVLSNPWFEETISGSGRIGSFILAVAQVLYAFLAPVTLPLSIVIYLVSITFIAAFDFFSAYAEKLSDLL